MPQSTPAPTTSSPSTASARSWTGRPVCPVPSERRSGPEASDDELLERYAEHESAAERPPYRSYREVMAAAARGVAADLGQAAGRGRGRGREPAVLARLPGQRPRAPAPAATVPPL